MVSADANEMRPIATRKTLIMRLKDTMDDAAWREFYQFYWDLIVNWAAMYGCDTALAKDIFQETMINLIRNLPKFDYDPEKGCFRSYLKTIVSRRVKDAYRREKRYRSSDELPQVAVNPSDSELDKIWIRSVFAQALRRAYGKVNQMTYKSFCLHVLDGLPVDVVADRLNVSRDRTIYEHKRRFLEILEREFFGLLVELKEGRSDYGKDPEEKRVFNQAFEEMLANRSDFRETVTIHVIPVAIFERLNYARKVFANGDFPVETGAYLCLVERPSGNKKDGDGGFGVKTAVKLSDKVLSDMPTETLLNQSWFKARDTGMTIGRAESNDMVLPDEFISGLHATIRKDPEGWSLIDENSTNGVMVNETRVRGKTFLKNGDIIEMTPYYQFIFYSNEA